MDSVGVFVKTGRFDLTQWGDVYPEIVGGFEDGSLLVSHRGRTARLAMDGITRLQPISRFLRVDRSGAVLTDYGTLPGRSIAIYAPEGNPIENPPRMWGLHPGPLFRVTRNSFYWANARLSEVRVLQLDGNLERIIRFRAQADEVHRDDIPVSADAFPQDIPRRARERLAEEIQNARSVAGFFSDFTVDELGNVWLREWTTAGRDPTAPVRWYIFDSDGLLRHVVQLPNQWRARTSHALIIGSDYILARERDEYGVETFRLVPLTRTSRNQED